jgi:hypothetical protein
LIKTQPSPEEELLAHSQSAYAGYNSGSRYCRYLDSSSKYAGNDQGYLRRLTLQPWRDLVTDFDREVKLNIDCLLDGDNLCAIAKPMTDDMKLAHHAVVVDSGATCLTQDEVQFSCVRDSRDSECLLATDSLARAQTPIRFKSIDPDWQTVTPERSEICGRVTRNLAAVGQFIEVRRTIAVATQGALDNDTVPTFLTQGQVVQVLDFEVKANGRRSYKISLPSIDASEPPVVGWINAGDNRDADDWVRVMADNEPHGSPGSILPSPIVTIPVVGSKVELRGGGPVTAFGGILIWGSPSDAQSSHAKPVGRLPYGAQVRVLETVITGTDNQVYLRVDTNPMGYVYGGKTYPALTVFDWVRILP